MCRMSNTEQNPRSSAQFVTIEAGFEGQRLDNFLLNMLKGVPKSYVYRIVRKGEVRVNKGRIKVNYRLNVGDLVRIPPMRLPEKKEEGYVDQHWLERLESSIIHEDPRLIVLNKPSGIAVHGGSGLSFGVIEALRKLRPDERQLELVHRIDRETSGCLLITKKRSALRTLHELMRSNKIDKRYMALLIGNWRRDKVDVDVPLLKNSMQGGERVVKVDPRGKDAQTQFRVVERFKSALLVEAKLLTGRTHQIRVHAAYLDTPILGDTKYGDEAGNKRYKQLGLRRLFLHAEHLRFRWPGERKDSVFKAPLDDELQAVLEKMR